MLAKPYQMYLNDSQKLQKACLKQIFRWKNLLKKKMVWSKRQRPLIMLLFHTHIITYTAINTDFFIKNYIINKVK